ncbi:hypothetical protein E2320_017950, partial [Naja naja]
QRETQPRKALPARWRILGTPLLPIWRAPFTRRGIHIGSLRPRPKPLRPAQQPDASNPAPALHRPEAPPRKGGGPRGGELHAVRRTTLHQPSRQRFLAASRARLTVVLRTGSFCVDEGMEAAEQQILVGKEKKVPGEKKNMEGTGDSSCSELSPWPDYINQRLEMYHKLKAEHDALLAERAAKDSQPIKVTLLDGKQIDAESWKTTPYQIACGISQGLADNTVIARVDKMVYWHSSAHIMGEAMERIYGGCLCYGPPIENGFYYDMFLEDGGVSSNDFPAIEVLCKKIMKEKQLFERLEVKKETLLEMFKYNKFKCRILNEKVTTPTTTVYRCGPLIDLCRGPHVRHTGKIKALKIHKNSSTYWEGKSDMETLQRVYGISFPDAKMLKEWEKFQEEAKNRDHRKIGRHYSDNMFSFEVEKEIFALKPMNCPGHCLMFDHRPRSWRELPLRLADFGVLHRNELSGTLTGEIKSCLEFLRAVYDVFGFSFKLHLSTRPEKFLGDIEVWNEAEKQLENSLNEFGEKWELNPGDGAFYGPKIKDAIGRYHQCATIQLDFQLPLRFNLTYMRPFWLSPQQVMVIPVGPTCDEYAQKVKQQFHDAGLMVDVDVDPGCTLNKKIRNAQLAQYNFILVVGEKEKACGTVNIRTRDNKIHGERTVPETVERLLQLKRDRSKNAEEEF